MSAVLVTGRGGLGDAIYARPFVRTIAERCSAAGSGTSAGDVYVSTSWPAIFADLPVRPVKRVGGLATQAYHGELVPASVWADPPNVADRISLRYRWRQLAQQVSILFEMAAVSGIRPASLALDLPPLPASPVAGTYAVVRPPAVRVDYPAPSREPPPEYLAAASELLSCAGYRVVTIGHFVPGLEEPNGTVPADMRFEHGELSLLEAIALVAGASIVVSAPCWLVPACVASGTPLVVIGGGCGGRNNPHALVDERLRARHVRWLLPDRYCMCRTRFHDCPKEIANLPAKLTTAIGALAVRSAA